MKGYIIIGLLTIWAFHFLTVRKAQSLWQHRFFSKQSLSCTYELNSRVVNTFGSTDKDDSTGALVARFVMSHEKADWPSSGLTLDGNGNIYYGNYFSEELISLDSNGNVNWKLPIRKSWLRDIIIFDGKLYFTTKYSN